MQKIIKNAARCKICGDVIESKSTHELSQMTVKALRLLEEKNHFQVLL